jgi:hypothetical protein
VFQIFPTRIPMEVDNQRRLRLNCGTGEAKIIRICISLVLH